MVPGIRIFNIAKIKRKIKRDERKILTASRGTIK